MTASKNSGCGAIGRQALETSCHPWIDVAEVADHRSGVGRLI